MDKKNHIQHIIDNYDNLEKELVTQLNYTCKHGTTLGSNREEIWKNLFERLVPKKFNIERGVFIMDSFGHCSKEVDLAIYDEQYTPYIFRYGTLKFIPIEAVSAVIECKSKIKRSKKNNKGLKDWCSSIDNLKTGKNSITRIVQGIHYGIDYNNNNNNTSQTSTTPIKIFCHIGNNDFMECGFDITVNTIKNRLNIEYNKKYINLLDWFLNCNHNTNFNEDSCNLEEEKKNLKNYLKDYVTNNENINKLKDYDLKSKKYVIEGNHTLLSFIFQFNQLLMLINNPIFFPHLDYVDMFNKNTSKGE